jgi:ATP-dependent RNA helicase RhlE
LPSRHGASLPDQVRELEAGAEIVVATPGRLLDLVWRGTIDFGSVEFLVLDEADRMLDMGFIDDIRTIISLLPEQRQSLLFSATFPDSIKRLTKTLMRDPATVQVTPRNSATTQVAHVVIRVENDDKREVLSRLIRGGRVSSALVFVRTKHGADRLSNQLFRDGIRVAAIHGNKAQSQRIAALDDFKAGRVSVLVATEVAARGIDIDALPHVINFDLPRSAEDYVHRIGRTGRAGADGIAISWSPRPSSRSCARSSSSSGDRSRSSRRARRCPTVPARGPMAGDPSAPPVVARPARAGRGARGRAAPARALPRGSGSPASARAPADESADAQGSLTPGKPPSAERAGPRRDRLRRLRGIVSGLAAPVQPAGSAAIRSSAGPCRCRGACFRREAPCPA